MRNLGLVQPQGIVYQQKFGHLTVPDRLRDHFQLESQMSDRGMGSKPLVLLSVIINEVRRGGTLVRQLSRAKERDRWDLLLPTGALRGALINLRLSWSGVTVPEAYNQRLTLQVTRVPCIPEGACHPYFFDIYRAPLHLNQAERSHSRAAFVPGCVQGPLPLMICLCRRRRTWHPRTVCSCSK